MAKSVASSFKGRSYQEANDFLGERHQRKIANNTWLVRTAPDVIGVKLHDTVIVAWDETDACCTVDTGGWNTVTTRARINQFLPDGVQVFMHKRQLTAQYRDQEARPFMQRFTFVVGDNLRHIHVHR